MFGQMGEEMRFCFALAAVRCFDPPRETVSRVRISNGTGSIQGARSDDLMLKLLREQIEGSKSDRSDR
jgi:hypothetical protein